MKLNDIRDNEGSSKERMRVGRGIGSGKGKQSGRGDDGNALVPRVHVCPPVWLGHYGIGVVIPASPWSRSHIRALQDEMKNSRRMSQSSRRALRPSSASRWRSASRSSMSTDGSVFTACVCQTMRDPVPRGSTRNDASCSARGRPDVTVYE